MIKQEDKQKLFRSLKKKFYSEEIIEGLTAKYMDIFPNLGKEQIYQLIDYITILIIGSFDPMYYDTIEKKLEIAKLVKRMHNDIPLEERRELNQNFLKLYFLNKKDQEVMSFLQDMELKLEGDINGFLELASEITKEMGELIGNTVLNTISFAEKNNITPQDNMLDRAIRSNLGKESWASRVERDKNEIKQVNFEENRTAF